MDDRDAVVALQSAATAYIVSRCLHVVADLGVADVLDETPRTAAELAKLVDAHAGSLECVLSLLSAHGIFEMQGGHYRHSSASRLLITDHPNSMLAFVSYFGLPLQWSAFGAMLHSIRTGRPSIEGAALRTSGRTCEASPGEYADLETAAAAKDRMQAAGIVAVYDFSGFTTLGLGGRDVGSLTEMIAAQSPGTGITWMAALRPDTVGRDAVPLCDGYVLIEVMQDYGDEDAAVILNALRRAAPTSSRLLLIEPLVSENANPDWSQVFRLQTVVMAGGIPRTRPQYEALLAQSGYVLEQHIQTQVGLSILTAVPIHGEIEQ
ncbi:MAG: methyltransferase [Caldilineaceae bacterium]